jgi:hypothetical protein
VNPGLDSTFSLLVNYLARIPEVDRKLTLRRNTPARLWITPPVKGRIRIDMAYPPSLL